MWFGACASTIGTFVQQFAQSWLVYDLTKDPFYLGLDLFLGQLPIIMFSLFGGVFADRLDRRKMLLTSQYIQMSCAFLLALLFLTHVVRVWHILALSFVVGVGQSFGGPAYSALLPTLVGPEDLAFVVRQLALLTPANVFTEIQRQNQEMLSVLLELQRCRDRKSVV